MKTDAYWAKRLEDLNEAMLGKGERYIETMNVEYAKAMARIQKQTERWYARLAQNNDVSLAEARKLLKANELREFKWTVEEYIEAGRKNAVDQRWMKQLENASAKVHITRLEELQTHLQHEVEQLAAKRQKGTAGVLGEIYRDSYHHSIFELDKGTGVGSSFSALDGRQIEKVLAKPWAPDGSNFSARIWADRTKLVAELQTILTQDLIRGEPSEKLIADFAKRMEVSRHAAARLVLTEAAYFSGQSRLDGYREHGVAKYQFVATLDRRTSDQCRGMDGRVFAIGEAQAGVNYPPLHTFCRSTTIPHFDDAAAGERAARAGDDGTYTVPGEMTYREWYKQHAAPGTSKLLSPPDASTNPENDGILKDEPTVFRRFQDENEVTAWNDEVSPKWLSSLTTEERSSIRLYSGSAYREINRHLREGGRSKERQAIIDSISSGLRKFNLQEPILVYRGLDTNIFGDDIDGLVGAEVVDSAFMSTSFLPSSAFVGSVQMEIRVPAGNYGAAIISLSNFPDEYEFLLDKGTRYVIQEASMENGTLNLIVEVIPIDDET